MWLSFKCTLVLFSLIFFFFCRKNKKKKNRTIVKSYLVTAVSMTFVSGIPLLWSSPSKKQLNNITPSSSTSNLSSTPSIESTPWGIFLILNGDSICDDFLRFAKLLSRNSLDVGDISGSPWPFGYRLAPPVDGNDEGAWWPLPFLMVFFGDCFSSISVQCFICFKVNSLPGFFTETLRLLSLFVTQSWSHFVNFSKTLGVNLQNKRWHRRKRHNVKMRTSA